MAKLFNRAKMDTSTTGSGTITLGSAVDGYQSFADAGVADSDVVQYVIEDGTSWEIGTGTYSATGTSLTRTPSESSNAGAAISLTGAAEVFISAIHSDFERLQNAGTTKVEATSTGATVTGNLAVTGTVDGRDVASDGSKLDGIESGATADQTASEILTAIKTVDGSGSGLDADTLDSYHATDFVGAAGDTMTGDLLVQSDIKATGQIRATGWWNTNTGTTGSGLATEIGVSGGESYILSYNRDNATYGDLNFAAVNINFDERGGTTTIENNEIWHAGNDGSGSGLDADKLDGLHESSFMRKESNVGLARALGWYPAYGSATESNVFWSDTEEAVGLYSSSDTTIGMASKAVRVTQGQKYRFTVPIKSSAADSDGLYVRIYYYTGDLPDGKFAVSNSATHPNVQEDTGGDTGWWENNSHTTSWRNFERTWTAPSTGYVSVVILNWTGFSGAVYVKQPDISLTEYDDLYVADQIIHVGDTNTYMQFHAADQWRVVTGGTERLEVNNTNTTVANTLLGKNATFDNGTSTTMNIKCDNAGNARLNLCGDSQGTGILFVGQSTSHGGGIQYNGDNSPAFDGSGSDYISLYRVAAGTVSWTARNYYNSTGWEFRGNITAYASDERLKKNIAPITDAVEKVKLLNGVTYDWIDECEDLGFQPSMKHETGVIAQDVQKVIPDAVTEAPFNSTSTEITGEERNYLTVDKEKIIPLLIEAIKEQQQKIEALQEAINGLTN